jgi:hypothetical protein
VYAVLSCLLEEERQQTELLLAAMP